MEAAVIAVLGTLLFVVWAVANRRHLSRREQQSADWSADAAERPDLWTSSAACVHCGVSGGLLELRDEAVHFTCLACGESHVRETRA